MWIKRWRARGRGVLRPQGSPPPFFSPVPLLLSNCQDSGVATVGLLSSIPRTTYTPPWPFKLTGANVEDSCTQFGYLQKYWKKQNSFRTCRSTPCSRGENNPVLVKLVRICLGGFVPHAPPLHSLICCCQKCGPSHFCPPRQVMKTALLCLHI